ncbi:AsmA-like C-terminal domain-containing protein [Campylobacter geochelonis]|uniref:YhdP family protein n=1 Tax=Campylobacter geochelonis TaxID=1780362 RepID=UPI00094D6035|nr:AsmA-like C-terminal domain-containing protein [Campylobacter geochelonis]
MRIISKIAKITLITIAILMVILSLLFVWLKFGINVGNLNFQDFTVKQLYIKFDKKILISADDIEIPLNLEPNSSSNHSSTNQIKKITTYFPYLNKFFKEINLKNIKVGENSATVLYKNDIFYIDSAFLKVDVKLKAKDDGFDISINELSLKDFELVIKGEMDANFANNLYDFNGSFQTHEINGKLDFDIKNGILNYYITDATATSLEHFMNELGIKTAMDKEISEWIYGKIIASRYDVTQLKGEIDLNNQDFMLDKLTGEAYAYDLNISFNDKLPSAYVGEAFIELRDGDLSFILKDPQYEGKSLFGSSVKITNLFKTGTKVLLNLATDSLLDKNVTNILKAYDINLPIAQTSGTLNSSLNLDINIEPYALKAHGKFELKNANLEIAGAKFSSKKASVELNDTDVDIKNANLKMANLFEANDINGKIDTVKMKAKFDANFAKVNINANDTKLYNRENFKSKVELDFSKKDTTLNIANLNTLITFKDKNTSIEISDITPLLPYSRLLKELGVRAGFVVINSPDFAKFNIVAKNVLFTTPFRKKDGLMYENDDLNIKVDKNKVFATTKSGLLSFNIDEKESINATIKNLDFILSNSDNNDSTNMPDVNFNAQNSFLVLKDLNKTIEFSSYSGNLNKKNIKFNGKTGENGDITLNLMPNLMWLFASGISGKDVNNFLNMQSFDDGNFTLKVVGDSQKDYRGEILIHDAFLKDYVLYQRLLSFLNSVPALLTFKTPDFNDKGFSVKDGKVYFMRKDNQILIQAMDFKGTSADIGGKGVIDLNTDDLNIDLEIKYLKDASSIIDYIPLVNQILLGSDRTISTVIKIRGTLQNPTYESQVLSDVLLSPFNIIKNTLELPFVMFE